MVFGLNKMASVNKERNKDMLYILIYHGSSTNILCQLLEEFSSTMQISVLSVEIRWVVHETHIHTCSGMGYPTSSEELNSYLILLGITGALMCFSSYGSLNSV